MTDDKSDTTKIGDWLITDDGLDSCVKAGPDRVNIEYFIERERLLKQHHSAAGVSDWTMQLASKSWIDTPAANTAMIDAVEAAIRKHYPNQAVIDFDATRAAAERAWHSTHQRPFGQTYEYELGEPTLARPTRERAERAAATDSIDCSDPPWLDAYPAEHRAMLRQYGVDPAVHPDAHACNLRVIAEAEAGATGEELARRAEGHQRAYILEEEKPNPIDDEDLPAAVEFEIEERIEDARHLRHMERTK